MAPPVSPRDLLLQLAHAAIEAAAPATCVPSHLPAPPRGGKTVVIGAGKAAAAMAQAVEAHWPRHAPLEGVVVTRYGHGAACARVGVIEAAHPLPDAASTRAADRILEAVRGLGPEDLVLALLSGGASALLAKPAPGLTLQDKQEIGRALLRSGATIQEMNCVRKHLSAIKGGRLALACAPARMVTLAISDVPGDDPSVIGSGPTVADSSSLAEARAVLARYDIHPSSAAAAVLHSAAAETPKPQDARLPPGSVRVIASARDALRAAAARAESLGITPIVLGDALTGEARALANEHAALALAIARGDMPRARPCVLLSGGETTVTVRGDGRGGRNTEYLLALAAASHAHPAISALALDTDGIDGTEDNAGALAGPDTLSRAAGRGLDPAACLANNDAYRFFAALDDLVITGPTRTNVNDFRAILIQDARPG